MIWGQFFGRAFDQMSIYLKPVRRLGVFPWNIPEMTRASFGPQVTIPKSKHMVNLKLSLAHDLKKFLCDSLTSEGWLRHRTLIQF